MNSSCEGTRSWSESLNVAWSRRDTWFKQGESYDVATWDRGRCNTSMKVSPCSTFAKLKTTYHNHSLQGKRTNRCIPDTLVPNARIWSLQASCRFWIYTRTWHQGLMGSRGQTLAPLVPRCLHPKRCCQNIVYSCWDVNNKLGTCWWHFIDPYVSPYSIHFVAAYINLPSC